MVGFSQFIGKKVFITCDNFRVCGKLVAYISAENGERGGAVLEVETAHGNRNFYAKCVENIEPLTDKHPVLTVKDMYPSLYQTLGIEKLPRNAMLNIVLNDGKTFTGEYTDWTSALDNEPDGESISVAVDKIDYELFLDDIASVKQIGVYSLTSKR